MLAPHPHPSPQGEMLAPHPHPSPQGEGLSDLVPSPLGRGLG